MADYQRELSYMTDVLQRLRLPVHLIRGEDRPEAWNPGLRAALGLQPDPRVAELLAGSRAAPRTIFKILDPFQCNYIFFRLPEPEKPVSVIIGPYLTFDPSREQILEHAERFGIPIPFHPQLFDYFASLPIYQDPSIILALVTSFGHIVWGKDGDFEIEDIHYEYTAPAAVSRDKLIEQENILLAMKQMEDRYNHENMLMEIVSKGLTHRAEAMVASFSRLNFQPRMPDPLRNLKNYCIICNTLLRKAAQKGGVHPLHLDKISTRFARAIENTPTLESGQSLIGEMVRAYCRLVKTHSLQQYSAIVQRTLTYIEANLSGDLSLHAIADIQKVTPGYLSSLFRKETGQTLIEYVNEQRMKTALQLVQGTQLQVQTIAQLCGFGDPNYFSKLFKQHYGITPLRFRKQHTWLSAQSDG